MEFEDKELTCKDCAEKFIWEAGEQDFFHGRGLLPPKRCKSCRQHRRDTVAKPAEAENETEIN